MAAWQNLTQIVLNGRRLATAVLHIGCGEIRAHAYTGIYIYIYVCMLMCGYLEVGIADSIKKSNKLEFSTLH